MKRKALSVLLLFTVLLIAMTSYAFAEEVDLVGEAIFDGKKIGSSLNSEKVADALSEMQPGDEITVTVNYRNTSGSETNWYMANEVLQTLEKADRARKVPEGTGTPEHGGYTYELIQTDGSGKETVLFSNSRVGGDATVSGMEGLEQAVNALEDWFYIDTLKPGQSGSVKLHVVFEGETEVNDYMDTDGGVSIKFAVEVPEAGGSTVKTGDDAVIWPYIAMFALGLILMIVLLVWRRRKGGDDHEA